MALSARNEIPSSFRELSRNALGGPKRTSPAKPRNYGGAVAGALGGLGGGALLSFLNGGRANAAEQTSATRGPSLMDSQFGRQLGRPADTTVPRSLRAPVTQPVDNTQYGKTIQDFIEQARQMVGAQRGEAESLISAQENALRGNAGAASDQIGKGYQALSAFIGGQAAPIQQAYQTGINQTGEIAGNTQESIQAANAAAAAQQQAIMARLGIQDANIPIANTGTSASEDMQQALTESAQRAQLTQNQMASNQQTELGYNTSAGTAAALEGRGQQNRITQDLTSRLADLTAQRSAVAGASEGDIISLAQQLFNSDYEQFQGNYGRRYDAQKDAMRFAQDMAEATAPAEQAPMNSTAYRALGPLGQANYALQQNGVDAGQAAIISKAIEQAYATGNIRSAADFAKIVRQAGGVSPQNQIDAANAAAIYYQYFQ